MSIWLVFILAGLITLLTRLSFILLVGRRSMPPLVGKVLRFIPPAVLTAIIFPEVFMRDGAMAITPANPRLLLKAGITTLVAAVIWLGIYLVVESDWISFRDMVRQ